MFSVTSDASSVFRSIKKVFTRTGVDRQEKVPPPIEVEFDGESVNRLNEIQLLAGHSDIVRVLARIDDRRIASASDDRSIIIWDVVTGKRLAWLSGHTQPVTCLLSIHGPDDKVILVSGSSDKAIRLWDVDAGLNIKVIPKAHDGSVKCLASLDNGCFCSGGNDHRLCVWNSEGKLVGLIDRKEGDYVHSMLVIRNNRLVVASDSSLFVYNLNTMTFHKSLSSSTERAHREAVRCLLHISDGLFASASLDGAIILWTTHTLTPLRTLNLQSTYQDEELHMFVYSVQHMVALGERYLLAAIGCGFSLFDALTGDCLVKCTKAHNSTVQHVLALYGGERILTCSSDSSIRIWGPDTAAQAVSTPTTPTLQNLGRRSSTASTMSTSSSLSVQTQPSMNSPKTWPGLDSFFPAGRRMSISSLSGGTNTPVKPACLGELMAHTDSVNALLPLSECSFVSCGSDGLLVLWKDGLVEAHKRNEIAQALMARYEIRADLQAGQQYDDLVF